MVLEKVSTKRGTRMQRVICKRTGRPKWRKSLTEMSRSMTGMSQKPKPNKPFSKVARPLMKRALELK